jgi:small subunit ribosomal protein S16
VATKIRLMRLGKIRAPYYRIVVADARTKREGRVIETIGKYHPKQEPSLIEVDSDRARYWLSVGAQPTEPVAAILKLTGDWQAHKGLPAPEQGVKTAAPKEDRKAVFEAAAKETIDADQKPAKKTAAKKAAPAKAAKKAATESPAKTPSTEASAEPPAEASEADVAEQATVADPAADAPAVEAGPVEIPAEAPEAEVVDQSVDAAPPASETPVEIPAEAPEADVVEQAAAVPPVEEAAE